MSGRYDNFFVGAEKLELADLARATQIVVRCLVGRTFIAHLMGLVLDGLELAALPLLETQDDRSERLALFAKAQALDVTINDIAAGSVLAGGTSDVMVLTVDGAGALGGLPQAPHEVSFEGIYAGERFRVELTLGPDSYELEALHCVIRRIAP